MLATCTLPKPRKIHMKNRFINAAWLAPIPLLLLVSGCGGVNLWPFDGAKSGGQSPTPSNATKYQCDGGKHFYVRYIDNGNAVWLIYPDREVSLAKASGPGTSYSNGVAVLNVNGNEATLTDGPAISFSGCKVVGK